jgi:hypothetical protein
MGATKRILRMIGLIAAGFIVLLIAGAILLYTPAAKNYIRSRAQAYARRQYGAELKIDRYGFNLLKGSIAVEGISLRSDSEPALAPLLSIKKAYIDLNLVSTLLGLTSVQFAELENVHIHIIVGKDGHMNLPDFGGGGGGGLLIKSLEIKNGNLSIEDRRQRIDLNFPSWQIQASDLGSDSSSRIFFNTNRSGAVNYQEKNFEISNLKIDAKATATALEIFKIQLIAAGCKADGSGVLRNFSNPVVDLKIDANIDLEQVAAVVGSMPGVNGRVIGVIHVTGPLGSLQIRGKLQGDISSVQSAGLLKPQTV